MVQSPIVLSDLHTDPARVVATSAGASLIDLDDGVLCLEFHSKGNTLDSDTVIMIEEAYRIIPGGYRGLVVGNQGANFSYGANLRWILAMLDEIGNGNKDAAFSVHAKRVQRAVVGMRTAPFPTVAAPFGLTVGGALELSLYCDRMQPYADMVAMLPEAAVGILPDLGGTSEMYIRCIDTAGAGKEAAGLRQAFETVIFMKRSKDAEDARSLQFLKPHDQISKDKEMLLNDAKARVLELADGYAAAQPRVGIPVLGDAGCKALDQAIVMGIAAGMATEYDGEVARAIARVMTGAPGPARMVSHAALHDFETTCFETLIWNPKTRERMQHMLETGQPLRN
ncbi:MAG: enoyl-CoA hydratase/isomerase family protein [Candidatus Eremiobacteraeota bacterium]|nr:enoyl-CoA hydratase/isomerase family protein [Candidatus Eremiobacteraeota bacterium]